MKPRISYLAAMRTVRKPKPTSRLSSPKAVVVAKVATAARKGRAIDWNQGTVTHGGGVTATIQALRRTRGPNKNPTKEQVAIRFDRDVLTAFRSDGPGWQTRINDALKEWLAARTRKAKVRRVHTDR